MTIQSPSPEIHRIVESFIAEVENDEIVWECYGTRATNTEPPEVIQITLKGSPIDMSFQLDKSVMKSIQGRAEHMWVEGAFDNSEFYKSLNRD